MLRRHLLQITDAPAVAPIPTTHVPAVHLHTIVPARREVVTTPLPIPVPAARVPAQFPPDVAPTPPALLPLRPGPILAVAIAAVAAEVAAAASAEVVEVAAEAVAEAAEAEAVVVNLPLPCQILNC